MSYLPAHATLEVPKSEWVADANAVTTLHLVWSADAAFDAPDAPAHVKTSFHPDMSHQIFGRDEEIAGYMNPKIDIYFAAGDMSSWVTFSASKVRKEDKRAIAEAERLQAMRQAEKEEQERKKRRANRKRNGQSDDDEEDEDEDESENDDANEQQGDEEDEEGEGEDDKLKDAFGVPVYNDNVMEILTTKEFTFESVGVTRTLLGASRSRTRDDFIHALQKSESSFVPPGTLDHSFTLDDGRKFNVYHGTFEDRSLRAYHARVEPFALWFIDMASFLDDDEKWNVWYLYEQKDGKEGLVGFCTAYPFFVWPENTRFSVSQFLIFPSHRKLGLGERLLRRIYSYAQVRPSIVDVSVETPVTDFIRLRDKTGLRMIQEAGFFSSMPAKQVSLHPDSREAKEVMDASLVVYNKNTIAAVQHKLKLSRHAIRRAYEVMKLVKIGSVPQADRKAYVDAFVLEIKKRVYAEHMAELKQRKMDERKMVLDEQFRRLLEYYRKLETF